MTAQQTDLVPMSSIVVAVEFPVSEDEIVAAKEKYAALEATTTAGYEQVRLAIAHLRTARTSIEKKRKQLKAPALDFGNRVDSLAALLVDQIEAIEAPLRVKKEDADAATALARRAAEDIARAEAEAKAKLEREAEEARLKAARATLEAEQAVFAAAEKKANKERSAREAADKAEREKVAAEQKAAREKIDADQRAIDNQKAELARAEEERKTKEKAAKDEAERVERERVEAIAKAEREKAEAARLEALLPEIEKVRAWAGPIRELALAAPTVESTEAKAAILWVTGRLATIATALEAFTPKGNA